MASRGAFKKREAELWASGPSFAMNNQRDGEQEQARVAERKIHDDQFGERTRL